MKTGSASGALQTRGLTAALAVIAIIMMTLGASSNAVASSNTANISAVVNNTGQQELFQQTDQSGFTLAIVNEDTGNAAITTWTRVGNQDVNAAQNEGNITTNTKTGMVIGNMANATNNTGGTAADAGAHHFDALFGGTSQGVEIHRSGASRKIHP